MEKIIHLSEVDSTNEYLKRNIAHFDNGTLVWADKQTKGKGSNDRSFASPVGGVYMSFLLAENDLLPYVTPVAAVAVRRALVSVFHVTPTIKWVNDLFLSGKKICGILCEKTSSSVIVGIGVNLAPPESGFPEEIKEIAGTVCHTYPPVAVRETFVKRCYDEFFSLFSADRIPSGMNEYAVNSCVVGKDVAVVRGEETVRGKAVRIESDGSLSIETEKGVVTVHSGSLTLC